MGCLLSTQKDDGKNKGRAKVAQKDVGEIAVFVPGLRAPKDVDFYSTLSQILPNSVIEHLSALRDRIVVMAPAASKQRRRSVTQYEDSQLSDLLQFLQEYLPVLLGLVKHGAPKDKVPFVWINQVDENEETTMADAWYEVLSVLHLMAMLCLSYANSLLLTGNTDGYNAKASEEARCRSIDLMLQAAGYLDCAVNIVVPQIPQQQRKELPVDLTEEVLQALHFQALGQGIYIQLGMAIDSPKATLAVKRRLACEMVKCWNQAYDRINQIRISQGWAGKHVVFVKWKLAEAKAVAYYYHGLVLDEANTEKSHAMSMAALIAAEEFLKECKSTRQLFHATAPISRNPSTCCSLKSLSESIPKDVSSKVQINQHLYNRDNFMKVVPALPDFVIALKPDEYELPPLDPTWNDQNTHQLQLEFYG